MVDRKVRLLLSVLLFTLSTTANARPDIRCQAPTLNEDGSPLTDLASYRIYWGTEAGNYTSVVNVTDPGFCDGVQVYDLDLAGDLYVVMTALNSYGNESVYSNEIFFPDGSLKVPRQPVLLNN